MRWCPARVTWRLARKARSFSLARRRRRFMRWLLMQPRVSQAGSRNSRGVRDECAKRSLFRQGRSALCREVNRVLSFPRAEEDYQDPSVRAKAIVEQDKLLPVEDA